jgi:hypothetical protein
VVVLGGRVGVVACLVVEDVGFIVRDIVVEVQAERITVTVISSIAIILVIRISHPLCISPLARIVVPYLDYVNDKIIF